MSGMSLTDVINTEIKKAMLAKDEAGLRGLRAVKSALLLAQTEKGAGAGISEADEVKILQKLVKQRKESAEIYVSQGREDLAKKEQEEVEVIERFLPRQMNEAEVEQVVKEIILSLGASSPSDMGKVMGVASKQLAGKADNKLVSEKVKALLSNN